MKIRAKLLAGFITVALLCGIVGVLGIVQMSGMQAELRNQSVNYIPTIVAINQIMAQSYRLDAAVRFITNPSGFNDEVFMEKAKKDFSDARAARNDAIKAWEATTNTPEAQRLWEAFKASLPAAVAYNDSLLALVDRARKAPATVTPVAQTRGVPTPAAQASERDALIAQIFELLSGDKRSVVYDMVANAQKVADYDMKHYGQDLPNAAVASASASIAILIVITIIGFGAAIILGLILGGIISSPLKKITAAVAKIASGDLSQKLDNSSKDELGVLAGSVNICIDNINALVADVGMLSTAAIEGKLATRADVSKHQGEYKKIVDGVNKTLDALINPINVTARYVDDISKGVIPPIITDTYNGDFNIIKNNLNSVVKMMSELLKETDFIVKAAADGELDKISSFGAQKVCIRFWRASSCHVARIAQPFKRWCIVASRRPGKLG